MTCLSLGFFANLLIWLVVIGAVVLILKILLPYVLGPLGTHGSVISQVVNIVLWAAVAIFVIWIAFALLSCFIGSPLSFPSR